MSERISHFDYRKDIFLPLFLVKPKNLLTFVAHLAGPNASFIAQFTTRTSTSTKNRRA